MEEANTYSELMIQSGFRLDSACYNTLINLRCQEGKLDDAFELLSMMEEGGLESDEYTFSILVNGLCKMGHIEAAQKQLCYMEMKDMESNVVAYNCLVDALCKSDQVDAAIKLLHDMKLKDDFTYTSLVHGLCKVGRYHMASKFLRICLREGNSVLASAKRAVIAGLRSSGFKNDVRKVRSALRMARLLKP
jgi:pentatricopeptide repeat protein